MSEEHDHDFENELADVMAQSNGNKAGQEQKVNNPAETTSPPSSPPAQPDRSKERILSQAEIDAILAQMDLG